MAARLQEPNPLFIDIGCGSGLSSAILTSKGIPWVGTDISLPMLHLAAANPLCSGKLALSNMAQGLPLRTELFDAAISISAVQWLCVAEDPKRAIHRLMVDLRRCLKPSARAALQVYVQDDSQAALLLNGALEAGLTAEFFMDLPHSTPAKKFFLLLEKSRESSEEREVRMTAIGSSSSGGVLLPQHPCVLAWPSTACCVLPWIHHVLSTSTNSTIPSTCYSTGTNEEKEDVTALGDVKARMLHEHAHLGKRALRLLRRCVNGGPMQTHMSANTDIDEERKKEEGKKDSATAHMLETSAVHRGVVPCGGAFAVHFWPRGSTAINLAPSAQDDKKVKSKDVDANAACSSENLEKTENIKDINDTLQTLLGDEALVLNESEIRSVAPSMSPSDVLWRSCIHQAKVKSEGGAEDHDLEKKKENKKDAFYRLEHLSFPIEESSSCGAENSSQCVFSTHLAILHAKKMPQLLVICSHHDNVHSGLQHARTQVSAFCASHKASVVGIDVVEHAETEDYRLSCAWVLYVSGLADIERGLMAEWLSELNTPLD